jgi:hypothetical protein
MKGNISNSCCMKNLFTRSDDFPDDGLKAEDKAAKAEALWVGPP